jgi:hypothetical protein
MYGSPIWKGGSKKKWTTLVGLLSRCHRLMASNLEFFQRNKYGEATLIIDRCLLESAVKIRWLSQDGSEERLQRYLEDSIRHDIELRDIIRTNIDERGGTVQVIEDRMLRSIQRHMDAAGIAEADVPSLRRMPDLASLTRDIGEPRLMYTVIGKLASHHVHGTWGSLLATYLDEVGPDSFEPRSRAIPSHVNQYVMHPLMVLSACRDYLSYNLDGSEEKECLLAVIDHAEEEILAINEEVVGNDRDPVYAEG